MINVRLFCLVSFSRHHNIIVAKRDLLFSLINVIKAVGNNKQSTEPPQLLAILLLSSPCVRMFLSLFPLVLFNLGGLAGSKVLEYPDPENPKLSKERIVFELESFGVIEMALFPDVAPATVRHILEVASAGGYTTNHFFRVDRGFVAQARIHAYVDRVLNSGPQTCNLVQIAQKRRRSCFSPTRLLATPAGRRRPGQPPRPHAPAQLGALPEKGAGRV